MKEGDYVRLDRGQGIARIDEINDGICYLDREIYDEYGDETFILSKKDIIKSSPNRLDLIEIGDYVNGFPVINTAEESVTIVTMLFFEVKEKDIKSIVTKEQFRNLEYVINNNSNKENFS